MAAGSSQFDGVTPPVLCWWYDMAKLFGIDIQAVVGSSFKGQLRKFTLHAMAETIGPSGATVEVATNYPAEGIVSKWSAQTAVLRGYPSNAVKLLLLQKGLAVAPSLGHTITAAGGLWRIVDVEQDAGEATWSVAAVPV